MPKWIKGRNGKFLGSIGFGKKNTPTAQTGIPLPPPPGIPGVTNPNDSYDGVWNAYQTVTLTDPDGKDYFSNLEKVKNGQGNFSATFIDEQNLKYAATQYAALGHDEQSQVLTEARDAAKNGNLKLANLLYDASIDGEAHYDRMTSGYGTKISQFIYDSMKNGYDRADEATDEFYRLLNVPFTTSGWDGNPPKTYPFHGGDVAKQLSIVAGHVESATYEKEFDSRRGLEPMKKKVYPDELIKEAKKYADIHMVTGEPGQEQYARSEYTNFLDKVRNCHRNSQQLVTLRIDNRLRAAQSAIAHDANASKDPFDWI